MFRKLIEQKWEAVINKCKAAEYEAMMPPLNGWSVDVIIDKDGNIWTEGPRTAGTETEAEWNGDALCIRLLAGFHEERREAKKHV